MKLILRLMILSLPLLFLASCHTSGGSVKRTHKRTKHESVVHKKPSHNANENKNVGNRKLGEIRIDLNDRRGKKVAKEAKEWIGTPYKYAGYEKGEGTDCSGMVLSVYLEATGIKLPRNSAKQAEFCEPVSGKNLKIGDLCFFATGKDPDKVSHVGIMLDEENFIHASTSKGVVISNITTPYYTRTFMGFGRVPD